MDWGKIARAARRTAAAAFRRRYRLRGPHEHKLARCDWRLETIAPDGTVLAVREFTNMIVNAGFDAAKDRLFNPATAVALFGYIAIGSDATPAGSGDVALGAELARQAVNYTDAGTAVCTIDTTFAAGVGTGTIAEVGAFNDPAAGTMFNRYASFGAIPKGAGDALKATCTITLSNA